MRRVKVDNIKDAKRKMNQAGLEENPKLVRKPGVETSCPHIAQMFALHHGSDVADELTHSLMPHLRHRAKGMKARAY